MNEMNVYVKILYYWGAGAYSGLNGSVAWKNKLLRLLKVGGGR